MQRFFLYKQAYMFTLPLFLIGLFVNTFQLIYAAIYFVITISMIFELTQIREFINSSAANHYEHASRWNMFNYSVSAYLIFSGLFYTLSPLPGAINVFLLWTGLVLGFHFIVPRYLPKLHRTMMTDYVELQMPGVDRKLIEAVVGVVLQNPQVTPAQLAAQWKVDELTIRGIFEYYAAYLQRTAQIFGFLPAFGQSIKEFVGGFGDNGEPANLAPIKPETAAVPQPLAQPAQIPAAVAPPPQTVAPAPSSDEPLPAAVPQVQAPSQVQQPTPAAAAPQSPVGQ